MVGGGAAATAVDMVVGVVVARARREGEGERGVVEVLRWWAWASFACVASLTQCGPALQQLATDQVGKSGSSAQECPDCEMGSMPCVCVQISQIHATQYTLNTRSLFCRKGYDRGGRNETATDEARQVPLAKDASRCLS